MIFTAAALGLAPFWVGCGYALGFGLPLTATLVRPLQDPQSSSQGTLKLTGRIHANVQRAQLAGASALIGAAAVLILAEL